MVQVLKTGKKKHNDSSSSGGDSEEEDEIFSGSCKESDLLSRQRKLRKLSAEKPGALLVLVKGYAHMHEQLGTLFGDHMGSGSSEQALQPGAVRYLLSTALPLMDVKRLGEERLREMRTLAGALDLVASGKISMTGDLLMQRFKSILIDGGAGWDVGGSLIGGVKLCEELGSEGCQE